MMHYNDNAIEGFVMDYCRIDSDMETCQIKIYIDTAVQYLINAGVPYSKSGEPLYMLAVALLVAHWLENRCVVTVENNTAIKYSLQHILMQLKYCESDEE